MSLFRSVTKCPTCEEEIVVEYEAEEPRSPMEHISAVVELVKYHEWANHREEST